MNDSLERPWGRNEGEVSPEEDLFAEVRRIWMTELKPHFDLEREFLMNHGVASGYDRQYIARVLEDQGTMEKLVWSSGDGNIREFTRLLAAYLRFKQDYFNYLVGRVLGQEVEISPPEAE